MLVHSLITLGLGRPWFATALVSAVLLVLVLVNNAKMKALREPFIVQDFDYFLDAIRHPRLYIPFFGWGKFLGAVLAGTIAVTVGMWGETTPEERFSWSGQLGGFFLTGTGALLLLLSGKTKLGAVNFDPHKEVQQLGLLACLWRYGEALQIQPATESPFDCLAPFSAGEKPPHFVAVQSESFFDPRELYAGIRTEVLAEFDRLKGEAVAHGKLIVPAWGANTVRTEFAVLSGINADKLGVHRFNPYREIAGGWNVPTLASYLKRSGYRTICIHPYPASFYLRDRVFQRLGFDEFLDIKAFDKPERFGPYVSDDAVAGLVDEVLRKAMGPVFIYVITMENHGPLHLEQVSAGDIDALYSVPPPEGCSDLTVYLRHLRNADRMLGRLRQILTQCEHPASLCWFGDHVPIMPSVYRVLGEPQGWVNYLLWAKRESKTAAWHAVTAHQLAEYWLRSTGAVEKG